MVVTGSRDLTASRGGSYESEAWVYARLRESITGDRPDLIISGDAEPVDRSAFRIADIARPVINWRMFGLNGYLYHCGYAFRRWRELPGPVTSPLARNIAMIAAAKKCLDAGWRVKGIALVAPWTRTNGTLHTVGLAKKSGIEIPVVTCPVDMQGRQQ